MALEAKKMIDTDLFVYTSANALDTKYSISVTAEFSHDMKCIRIQLSWFDVDILRLKGSQKAWSLVIIWIMYSNSFKQIEEH